MKKQNILLIILLAAAAVFVLAKSPLVKKKGALAPVPQPAAQEQGNAQASLSAEEIMAKYGDAVILIARMRDEKETGLGSGFIARPDGVCVTNYHVIKGAYPAHVKMKNGQVYKEISVIDADEARDVAVIKIEAENLPSVAIGDSDKVNVGERIMVIGNPYGFENTISDGLLSQIRESDKGVKLHQISAPISPGSSGGPVFNQKGEVIGIAAMSVIGGQNLNFSVPINYVAPLIGNPVKCTLADFAGVGQDECIKRMIMLQKAIEDYALANGKKTGEQVKTQDLIPGFLKEELRCPSVGGVYLFEKTGDTVTCSIHGKAEVVDRIAARRKNEREEIQREAEFKKMAETLNRNLNETVKLYEAGKNDEAERLYDEAKNMAAAAGKKLPDNVYQYIASSYALSKKYAEAAKSYEKALSINGRDLASCYELSRVYKAMGKPDEAARQLKKVLELDPRYQKAYEELAACYTAQKRYDDAVAVYKNAITLYPGEKHFYRSLSEIYRFLKQDEEAVAMYNEAIACLPNDKYFYEKLGEYYTAAGRYKDAEVLYEKAIKNFTGADAASLHNSLGDCFYAQKKYWYAVGEYSDAVFLDPQNPLYEFNIGRTHLDNGFCSKSILYFKNAIERGKQDAESYYYLARAYSDNNQPDEAKEAFKKAAELCTDPELKKSIEEAAGKLGDY